MHRRPQQIDLGLGLLCSSPSPVSVLPLSLLPRAAGFPADTHESRFMTELIARLLLFERVIVNAAVCSVSAQAHFNFVS